MMIRVTGTRYQENQVYVAPNGKLYRDVQFGNIWQCCKLIEGVETTEIWPESVKGQSEDTVMELVPNAKYNNRIDLT